MAAPSPRKKKPQTRKKRMSARIAEDKDCQLRHEKVAGTDIAKATGMTCLRLPPEDAAGKRASKVREAGATVPETEAAAAGSAARTSTFPGERHSRPASRCLHR